jgi:hypothetical protein
MPASRIQYSKTEDIDVWWIFVLGSPREGDALAGHGRANAMCVARRCCAREWNADFLFPASAPNHNRTN